jgi:hypothetical protein
MPTGALISRMALVRPRPDYERLCIKIGPTVIKGIAVKFVDDTTFEIIKPLTYAKVYTIQQQPAEEDHRWKMVLNGVTLITR